MTAMTTTLKPVRIKAALPGPDGKLTELWPEGLPIADPLQARAALALIVARTDSGFALDTQRSFRQFVAERDDRLNDHLVRASRSLKAYALACRQARWDRAPMPDSAEMRSTVLWHVIYATSWLTGVAETSNEAVTEAQDSAVALGWAFARLPNVPTPTDAEIAATGYSTGEFVTLKAVDVLRLMIAQFQRSERIADVLDVGQFRGTPAETLQQAKQAFLVTALEDMHDVPAILREGVLFTLDSLPKVPPLPR